MGRRAAQDCTALRRHSGRHRRPVRGRRSSGLQPRSPSTSCCSPSSGTPVGKIGTPATVRLEHQQQRDRHHFHRPRRQANHALMATCNAWWLNSADLRSRRGGVEHHHLGELRAAGVLEAVFPQGSRRAACAISMVPTGGGTGKCAVFFDPRPEGRSLPLLIIALLGSAGQPSRHLNANRQPSDDGTTIVAAMTADNCTGAAQTFNDTTAITWTRATAATCTKNDGTTVQVTSGQPRCSSLGCLIEPSATNLCLRNRDLSNAAWTASNATCTLTATGTDQASNTASTCTAGAGNATVLQAITVASAARNTSLYIKRRTGSGTINATRDNGSTWIDISTKVTGTWTRVTQADFSGLGTTSANPTVGIRIVTNGDAVDVDMFQDEAGSFATSAIITAGTSVTRNFDAASVAQPSWMTNVQGCIGHTVALLPGATTGGPRSFDIDLANGNGLLPLSATVMTMYDGTTLANKTVSDMRGRTVVSYGSWVGSVLTVAADGASITAAYDGALLNGPFYIGSGNNSGSVAAGIYSNIKLSSSSTGCQ